MFSFVSTTLPPHCPHPCQTILDQAGAKVPHCCLLRNGLLVVARDEGLYDYTLDTRWECSGREHLLDGGRDGRGEENLG